MKKLIGILFVLLVLGLSGCKQPIFDFPEVVLPDEVAKTVPSIMWWTAVNIGYESDSVMHYPKTEYWQSPIQTFVWRSGDCEDFSILSMYLIHKYLGLNPRMAIGYYNGGGHAWVEFGGSWWEPQNGSIVTNSTSYRLYKYLSYEDTIKRSTTTHRTIEPSDEQEDDGYRDWLALQGGE